MADLNKGTISISRDLVETFLQFPGTWHIVGCKFISDKDFFDHQTDVLILEVEGDGFEDGDKLTAKLSTQRLEDDKGVWMKAEWKIQ